MPKSRLDFWQPKLEGNARRDKRTMARLRRAGWRVAVVWECQLRDIVKLGIRLTRFLEKS